MTTVIRATGSVFNNQSLPIIAPLVTDGLVGAFRAGGFGLVDVSGNSRALTVVGSPTATEYGLRGNGTNGLMTDIGEPKTLTLMTISRVRKVDGVFKRAFVAGNYIVSNPIVGSSFFYAANSSYIQLKGSFTAVNTDSSAVRSSLEFSNGSLLADITPFIFTAVVIDAAGNTLTSYTPAISQTAKEVVSLTTLNRSLANRPLTVNGKPNYIQIASTPSSDLWDGDVEVAEVLIFDKALTQAQIMQQYKYSKAYMQDSKNITL